jgi:hypothetical protein
MTAIDVIGDIHGRLDALLALGETLGYDVARGWSHPQGRRPVFLGDLVDRGPASLEVSELVRDLVLAGRALCIMGNHEYNLVSWRLGIDTKRRRSSEPTLRDVEARPARWRPVLDFLRDLPVAVELDGLRLVHAAWHLPSLARIAPVLGRSPAGGDFGAKTLIASPFDERGLRSDLPREPAFEGLKERPHEIPLKGIETSCAPFMDEAEGHERSERRVRWWSDADGANDGSVPRDLPIVFGHYWHRPPIDGVLAPERLDGDPGWREEVRAIIAELPERGDVPALAQAVCVDMNGVAKLTKGARACLGALRWPERRLVWRCV